MFRPDAQHPQDAREPDAVNPAGSAIAPPGTGVGVGGSAHAPAPLSTFPPVSEPDDWDALFHAVQARLKLATDSSLATRPDHPPPGNEDTAEHVLATVLECREALQQLHDMSPPDRDRSDQLERETTRADTALFAQSRVMQRQGDTAAGRQAR